MNGITSGCGVWVWLSVCITLHVFTVEYVCVGVYDREGQSSSLYFSLLHLRACRIPRRFQHLREKHTPLHYSCLENPMDRGAWWSAVHGVARSQTRLSDITFLFHFHALEKEMATHSSVLAWRIPGTGEPGGLLSTGLHRVRHDWSNLAAAAVITLEEKT